MKKIFDSKAFVGFDDLLTLLLSEVHFPVSMNYFTALFANPPVLVERFGEHQRILFEGIKGLCDIQIGFYPLSSIRQLLKNEWPGSFELEYEALQKNEMKKYVLDGKMTYSLQVAGGCFTQFWDRITPLIEAKHGGNAQNWPGIFNFGRVIRNSFAHGNRVNVSNPNAAPVSWKSLTYTPAQNGRPVLYSDMGLGDLIVLIEDLTYAL